MHVAMENTCAVGMGDIAVHLGCLTALFMGRHSKRMVNCKIPGEALEACCYWTNGEWLEPIQVLLSRCSNTHILEGCGLAVSYVCCTSCTVQFFDNQQVLEDDAIAAFMMEYSVALIKHYSVVMMPFQASYPYALAKVCSNALEHHAQCVE